MKVKYFVDRFKNFEVSSSKIRTIMIEFFLKNGLYELCDQCRPRLVRVSAEIY